MKLRAYLKNKLTKRELDLLRASYDVIGDIAILEIPSRLVGKQKLIANTLLKSQKNIKTVLKKKGGHRGRYRIQQMVYLAGERRKTTRHKESGVFFDLNVEKSYFSPRLVTERRRISDLVKKKENVLVLFSGIAPYPIIIGKYSKAAHITGIEINPDAHGSAVENVKKNNLNDKITLIKGDAKKQVSKLSQKFDRIIMPLPKTSENFLPAALSVAKKGAWIHLYTFSKEDDIPELKRRVLKACSLKRKKCRIARAIKCGQHSARTYRYCMDFKYGV